MAQYQVAVTMTPATVTALADSGCNLYAFRAVQSSDRAGRPLLWMSLNYSAQTVVGWSDTYQAYTSSSPITQDKQILAGFWAAIEPGQLLSVQSGGVGNVTLGGQPGLISVLNTTSTAYTCGIGGGTGSGGTGSGTGGGLAPWCAFPLYGNNLQVIMPLAQILLMFSSQPVTPGTVVDGFYSESLTCGCPRSRDSYGPGILVDLTTANQRAVGYDINGGWSWDGYSWAQQVAAGADLVPLLIQPQ